MFDDIHALDSLEKIILELRKGNSLYSTHSEVTLYPVKYGDICDDMLHVTRYLPAHGTPKPAGLPTYIGLDVGCTGLFSVPVGFDLTTEIMDSNIPPAVAEAIRADILKGIPCVSPVWIPYPAYIALLGVAGRHVEPDFDIMINLFYKLPNCKVDSMEFDSFGDDGVIARRLYRSKLLCIGYKMEDICNI